MTVVPRVNLPVEDGPKWISHVEVSRDPEGQLVLTIVKRSGDDYGCVRIADQRMKQIMEFV